MNGEAIDFNGILTPMDIVVWIKKRTRQVFALIVDQSDLDNFIKDSQVVVV
jgi:hypothetical protein